MNQYSDLDTAIEIMANKIAFCKKIIREEQDKEYEVLLEQLREERNEMYNGNMEIIKKIIEVYGKELKDIYEGE